MVVTGYDPLFLLGRRQGIFVICDRYCIYYICVIYCMYCMYSIYRIYSIYLNSCAVKGFLVFSEIFLTWKKAFEKFSAAERRYSPSAGGRLRPLPRPVMERWEAPAMSTSGNVLPFPLARCVTDKRRRHSNYPLYSPNNHKF